MLDRTKSANLLPDEIRHLIDAFLPTRDFDTRSKAFLVLSAFCQNTRKSAFDAAKPNDAGRDTIVVTVGSHLVSRLEDPEDQLYLSGICALIALFQVDWEAASTIFNREGLVDLIVDQADTSPPATLPYVSRLLSQAAGHRACRSTFTQDIVERLEQSLKQTTMSALRAASSLAFVKLSRNPGLSSSLGTPPTQTYERDLEFYQITSSIVLSSEDNSSLADAVESLAYLSTNPSIKERITTDTQLLPKLFSLVPRKKQAGSDHSPEQSTLVYGILVVISQLCAHPPRLTEEQTQMEKLRQMAQAGKKSEGKGSSPYDGDDYVNKRITKLLDLGVLEVLVSASSTRLDSVGVRVTTGKTFLDIIEVRDNRGKVLQHGGAKVLTQIIKRGLNDMTSKSTEADVVYLSPIQALAKLSITAAPIQVFGPSETAMYDAIRPFSILLQHSSSTLLQRFEALMALTNLASQSAELCNRIAKAEGLATTMESMMLEDHPLVRRAAVELLCNLLAGSDDIFERYGGSSVSSNAKSKLEILIALSDVDDVATKLAASGALATLSISEPVCIMLADLQLEKHRTFNILAQLIGPDPDSAETSQPSSNPGLVHRGIVCARNIMAAVKDSPKRKELIGEARSSDLLKVLGLIVKTVPPEAMKMYRELVALSTSQ
ncbi:hypothetical protein ONZ45_g15829 [Pleurotus djamor]|nr:hypothetical protein ONZ45_g15829 [Pleurotus djamor]